MSESAGKADADRDHGGPRAEGVRSGVPGPGPKSSAAPPLGDASSRDRPANTLPQDPDILDETGVSDCLGEPFTSVLDMSTWSEGFGDIAQMMDRTAREIEQARQFETAAQKHVRERILPALRNPSRRNAPRSVGVWSAPPEEVARFQRGVLFRGQAEACDGSLQPFQTLALTIIQIAVAKVSYESDGSTWSHRLYWRDLRVNNLEDIGTRINELLQIRGANTATSGKRRRNPGKVSELLRRGLMAYAERAVLLNESDAMWRIGHGPVAPYELLTGSGSMELLCTALDVLSRLILDHKRFLFVPSDPTSNDLLTLGHALLPLEYAIVSTTDLQMRRIVEGGHYGAQYQKRALDFVDEAGPKVVVGVYRASAYSPPYLFYAHDDYAHDAATLAIADSRIQEYRGFPMLIDLADGVCGATFDGTSFRSSIETVYSEKGIPFEYLPERHNRPS